MDDDIIRLVCGHLDSKTAFAVALTHRRFREPALDRVWYRIKSFKPFLSCLPEDAWAVARSDTGPYVEYILHRNLTAEDLQRYLTYYAPRIRVVALDQYYQAVMPSIELLQGIQLAADYQHGVLSPSLRRCEWTCAMDIPTISPFVDCDRISPFMSLFIGSQVESLLLEDLVAHRPLSMASLHSHTRRLTCLKELQIGGHPEDSWHSEYFTSYSWDYLERFSIHFISPAILRRLATLPRLQRLSVSDSEEFAEHLSSERPSPRSQDFASLRELDLELQTLSYLEDLLKYLPVTNQVSAVRCTSWAYADTSVYRSVIDAVRRRCNRNCLKHISLYDERPDWDDPSTNEEALDSDLGEPVSLAPLYDFRLLETVSVRLSKPLQVGPEDVGKITTAWPNIQHLDLCTITPSLGRLPAIDHADLLRLVRGCRSLRYLGLRFDATRIGEQEGKDGGETFGLRTLRVGESPICSPSRVLGFIKRHFPRLEKLDANHDFPAGVARPTMLEKRWAAVVDGL